MKLSKQQINALAMAFCKERNAGYDAELKRREEEARSAWDKTPDGKLYAKLPKWMKDRLEGWALNEQVNKQVNKVWKGKPMPKKVDLNDVERAIILATIDAQSTDDIQKFLAKQFAK